MPRRPPKKLDPLLDLSGHLLVLQALPIPLDPNTLFIRRAPIELEVGSGKGLFLSSASAAAPERNFLGAEIVAGYARLCAGKLAMLPDACLAGLHVYFPDPWWKARHRKRRVLSAAFLQHAGRVLKPGGQLHIWTDVEDYFRESMVMSHATDLFGDPQEEQTQSAQHDLDYRTHFDRRTRLAGAPVWRALLQRTDAAAGCTRVDSPAFHL